MTYLGQIIGACSDVEAFTGAGSCPKEEGKTVALLITKPGAYYPMDSTEFINEIPSHVNSTDRLQMWPIKNIIDNQPNGGDVQTATKGAWGGDAPTGLAGFSEGYQVGTGGDCLYKELAAFNKKPVRVFRIDDEGFIYGTIIKVGNENYFAGFDAILYTTKTKATGSATYILMTTAYYTATKEEQEKNMYAFEIGMGNIPDGLIGLVLKNGASAGQGTVVAACGAEDITETYADDWSAEMFLNAAGANPTTVEYNNGVLTFTPAAAYRVASAQVLAAGNIVGYGGVNQLTTIS